MTLAPCHDASTLAEMIAQRCAQATLHGASWQVCCPSHDDSTPSLSITPKDNRVLLKCFAGCATTAILSSLGLTMSDLFVQGSSNGHKPIVALYDYVDAQGTLRHQTVRYDPKKFSQRRPDPVTPGAYVWDLKGIEPVLYNLPAVLTAIERGDTIYLVEGEKDAETLIRHGLVGTTNAMGAGKWRHSYTDTLRGAHVVLIPDNDPQGRDHMARVGQSLQGTVASLTRVRLPLVSPKGDVTDWLQDGHTIEEFHREVEQTPPEPCTAAPPQTLAEPDTAKPAAFASALVSLKDLLGLQLPPLAYHLDWLINPSLAMIYGPAGVGKTNFLLSLALSLAAHTPFLKWQPQHDGCGVLYLDGEMSIAELQDRANKLAGTATDAPLTFLPSELVQRRVERDLTLSTPQNREEIDAMLQAHPHLKVLVLDNVSCLFPGIDEDKKTAWEPVNAWLIRLRHRGITVLVGHHAGKSGQQRGTSGRGDHLNAILSLSYPPGHTARDGCRFHLHFEKSRSVKGDTVEPLDIRLDETPEGCVWTFAPLNASQTTQIALMLADGMPPRAIADELKISASYVYRLKRKLMGP